MMLKALEAAKDELGLLAFDEPMDYLQLDDYNVWSNLKDCKKSMRIIHDLEVRRLLKCAYERTVFAQEEIVSSVISNEQVRDEMRGEIARKARVSEEDVFIDVPSLSSVPYHHAAEIQPMDIPVFRRTATGKKLVQLSEVSRVVGVLRTFMNLVRVYTWEESRGKVEVAARQILGEVPMSGKISY